MDGHGIIRCSECDKLIAQCRCIEGHRNVSYQVCTECQKGSKTDTKKLESLKYVPECKTAIVGPCPKKCSECKDSDHHWIASHHIRNGPVMVCKYCSAWKYYEDEDAKPAVVGNGCDIRIECSLCHGSGFDPERSTCKTHYVADVPCPKCSKPITGKVSVVHKEFVMPARSILDQENADIERLSKVTITAQHAASLGALVEHWKELLKYISPVADVDRGGLSTEYCDELLEDLKG